MGKKSKKKQSGAAKAKAAGASLESSTGMAEKNGFVFSGGSSNKKQRCVGCLALLKDPNKAHECPGCWQILCWRCERKTFRECPNGTACVNPAKRCLSCFDGDILNSLVDMTEEHSGESVPPEMRIPLLQECIAGDDFCITDKAIPFQFCGGEDCTASGCYHCLMHSANTALYHCAVCQRIRCFNCMAAESHIDINPPGKDVMALFSASAAKQPITPDLMNAAVDSMRRDTPNKWVSCSECNASFCCGCLDEESARSAISCVLTKRSDRFRCSACYWKSKPCTNPSCPNEVGVPTKRCGGCHLNRYCSVECQAVMYLNHFDKCTRIENKRAAAEKKAG